MKNLTKIMGNGELDRNQLTQMCEAVFRKEFNSVCAWSEFIPNKNKPYSIVNIDISIIKLDNIGLVHIQKIEKRYMFMILL
jgi:hypothetical protein